MPVDALGHSYEKNRNIDTSAVGQQPGGADPIRRTVGKLWAPDRRDMIWIDSNPQAGREMKKMHPLLVPSPKAFNKRTGIVIGLPMSTAPLNETNPFAAKFVGPGRKAFYIPGHQPNQMIATG